MDDACSIAVLQEMVNDLNELNMLGTYLAHIHSNLSFLSHSVTTLDHKFIGRNNKRNQQHGRCVSKTKIPLIFL
jgi:hypothetical protein